MLYIVYKVFDSSKKYKDYNTKIKMKTIDQKNGNKDIKKSS